ncbi:MAG: M48 family metallopeptidase [Tannerellaceae bacterium]|jgi:predicted metal-dependent hydrolase|nr:M48 family metallopeptidase [Tannerellaceae bacterium]
MEKMQYNGLRTNTFSLHIFRTERTNFYMTLADGVLHIACPQRTDFEDLRVRKLIGNMIENALRYEAKRILPARLDKLAREHGFSYARVRISGAATRWGSCNSKGNINLAFRLMYLPDNLIDYVLLHELCHTVEMNHGKRFWALMGRVTSGHVSALRGELNTAGYSLRLFMKSFWDDVCRALGKAPA